MKMLSLVMFVIGVNITFGQKLMFVENYKKLDRKTYLLTVDTEAEAIMEHSRVLDMNGYDTTLTAYTKGDNPVVFSYLLVRKKKKHLYATFILKNKDKFDVLFIEFVNKDKRFFNVLDKNGELVELIYQKPE